MAVDIVRVVPSLRVGGSGMAVDIVRVVAGLVILVIAADRLVLSAVRIAKVLNVSAIIIGAVIVGFGTSIPEFVVSAVAASDGNLELAMSNVVASNIANVTLVLGVAALMAVITTRTAVIRREGLLMLGSVTLLAAFLLSGSVNRIGGAVLLVAMVGALVILLRWSRDEDAEADLDTIDADKNPLTVEIVYGLVALVATMVAGRVLLDGVVGIGAELGLASSWVS
jgi:cation:H+ antiporter